VWKQSRAIFKGTDIGKVTNKGKYNQEKRKQVTRSKRKKVIRETNTNNLKSTKIYIVAH